MSELGANSLRSNSSSFNSPITFETSGGTENGRLCRAFVNFNGQGAVAIRANFNVNSITDNGTGDYTANFTNAMSDANYSVAHAKKNDQGSVSSISVIVTNNSGSHRMETYIANPGIYYQNRDEPIVCITIFR